ncbi:uncharacterized protein LOC124436412 [Xenia sp. Carnegie-2017]|uniref:uncharacterized protein LOC124436412 n=1 Tax=Xenia sp. Carnegie-2017 TaxID=2897299 RepID=UPI001F0388A6|nr:uncharacterized protein LOC124436412 [Xenia sp. Carnegie-2017]
MFGNIKDKLYNVQHDLSKGLRTISIKAKSANQRIVRKAAFAIAEDVNVKSNDQCFDCNLEAGSDILASFYKNWAHIHWYGKDLAVDADEMDAIIFARLKKMAALDRAITSFHQELSFLPDVLEKVDQATEKIEEMHSEIDKYEKLIDEFEEASVRKILEQRKAKEKKIFERTVEHFEYEYNNLQEQYKEKKSKDDEQTRQIEKQASLERQKVYEDVFLQEMQHYIQYGATEKAIAGLPASQSLEDITLDDDIDLEEELKAFLQPDEPDETLDKATNDENISEAGDPEEEKE